MDEKLLADLFVPFGEILNVNMPKPDLPSSKDTHRGFGYVEFESPADAREAIDNIDQSELFGRVIKVAHARPQKDVSEGLGSKTAVWEQEGYLAKYAIKRGNSSGDEKSKQQETSPMNDVEALNVAGPREL